MTGFRMMVRTSFTIGVLLAHSSLLQADVYGSMLGTIRDATSATVANVAVTITSVETNLTQQTITDPAGEYRFLAVPVGTYKVEASHAGFRTFIARNVLVAVSQERRVDITLNVGSLEQKVEVTAAASRWKPPARN
jgi:hypothetical protein